jgi:hypothetical protein
MRRQGLVYAQQSCFIVFGISDFGVRNENQKIRTAEQLKAERQQEADCSSNRTSEDPKFRKKIT